jgi:hypothetical protein
MHVHVRGVSMLPANPAVEVYNSQIVTPAVGMHMTDNDCSHFFKLTKD